MKTLLIVLVLMIGTTKAENINFKKINDALELIHNITACHLFVTSGHRTPEHNKKVGGAKNSWHLKENGAADFVPFKCDLTIQEVGEIACKYVSTIIYKNHIHIDLRKNKLCIKGKYNK